MIPNETFCRGAHQHQLHFFQAFDLKLGAKVRTPQFFDLEWHRRARKTTAAINLLIRECCRVPNTKYIYIAPTMVQARNIVWDDPQMLRAYLPNKREMGWETNEQKMLVTFKNLSQLKVAGSDNPDSLRGMDFIGAVLDEAALMKPELLTEILRPIVAGPLPPYLDKYDIFRWLCFLYTPKGINWATQMFDSACMIGEGGILPDKGIAPKLRQDWYASRLDGEQVNILSKTEIKRMQDEVKSGLIPQAFYDQEIRCSRVTSEEMTLITSAMIQALNEHHEKVKQSYIKEYRKIVSIDPAWGGDVCKIMGIVNNTVEEEKNILNRYVAGDIILAAKLVARDIETKNFIVDTVNDLSIADGLAGDEAGYNVQYFKSSNAAKEKTDSQQAIRCANRRAEAYLYTAQQIHNFNAGPIKSLELRRQLVSASRYTTQGGSGRMLIIPKLIIKEDLGCSPDDADCYVMGVWGSQNVQPEGEKSKTVNFAARNLVPDAIGV